jgi:hypothetical protein
MKAIFSYWNCNNSRFFYNIEMAEAANTAAQKSGYKTCLYTDIQGYENLGLKIPYDEVILFDENILEQFYPKIWSLGKILAMSLVREPFIHLDFDFFLFKKLDEDIEQKDFFSLYHEPWINNNAGLQEVIKKIINLYPEEELKKEINNLGYFSSNFSIVGGQKFREISFVCEKIINFGISCKEQLARLDLGEFDSPGWVLPVTFEQILIPYLLKMNFNIDNYTMIPIPKEIYDKIEIDVNDIDNFNPGLIEILKSEFIKRKMVHLHGNKEEKFTLIKEKILDRLQP